MRGWTVWIPMLIMGVVMQLAERYLPPFLARKVKHATSGTVALLLPQQPTPSWVVWVVAVTCILVIINESSENCKEEALEESRKATPDLYGRGAGPVIQAGWWTHPDTGVCLFALSIILCLIFQFPLTILSPMLFADPAAALIGRLYQRFYSEQAAVQHETKYTSMQRDTKTTTTTTPVTPYSKTLVGSLTFFVVATVAIYYLWEFTDWYLAAYISMVLTMVEALSAKGLDNISVPVVSCLACYFHRARPVFL